MKVHWSPNKGYYHIVLRPWFKVTLVIIGIMGLIAFAKYI